MDSSEFSYQLKYDSLIFAGRKVVCNVRVRVISFPSQGVRKASVLCCSHFVDCIGRGVKRKRNNAVFLYHLPSTIYSSPLSLLLFLVLLLLTILFLFIFCFSVLYNSNFYSSPVPSHIPSPYPSWYYYNFSLPLYSCGYFFSSSSIIFICFCFLFCFSFLTFHSLCRVCSCFPHLF